MAEKSAIVSFTDRQLRELGARKDLLSLRPSPVLFDLPLASGAIRNIELGSPSHDKTKKLFGAIDFIAKEGTEVVIPHTATIIDVVTGFGPDGNDEKYAKSANRLSLAISLNMAEYLYVDLIHVQPNVLAGASKGKEIAVGTPIGTIDTSGWTTEPHLHMFAEKIFITPETNQRNEFMDTPVRIRFANKYMLNFNARFLYPR